MVPKVIRNRGCPERSFGWCFVVDYCHSATVHTLILLQVHSATNVAEADCCSCGIACACRSDLCNAISDRIRNIELIIPYITDFAE